ncbi:MAG: hypothetical protein HY319_26070 [Armatimonadetes bacterium]|nr:hypothetical protein [Armatimonadota bacterium]
MTNMRRELRGTIEELESSHEARLQESGFDEHLIKPPDLRKFNNWLCDLHSRTC